MENKELIYTEQQINQIVGLINNLEIKGINNMNNILTVLNILESFKKNETK